MTRHTMLFSHTFSKKFVYLPLFLYGFIIVVCVLTLPYSSTFILLRKTELETIPAHWWQLWTAHWVHYDVKHALINVSNFLFLTLFFTRQKQRFVILLYHASVLFLLAAPLLSLFIFCYTSYLYYFGFSALVDTYLAWLCLIEKQKQKKLFFTLILMMVFFKSLYPDWSAFSWTKESFPVANQAHLLGIILGLAIGTIHRISLFFLFNHVRKSDDLSLP
jgi:membrane associated rhomboid family serine protease